MAHRLLGEQVCAVPIAELSPVELALVPLNGGNIVRRALTLAQAFRLADALNAALVRAVEGLELGPDWQGR